MKKKAYLLYCTLVLLACLIPFLGMAVRPTMQTTENTTLAAWPKLRTDAGLNLSFLQEAGAYFTDHFAFRQELVAANARIRGDLFAVSASDSVIVGKNGWLYYEATLDDFQHNHALSDRMLFNIAHNLSLMQEYAESLGETFVFAVAPNKNTLYGENMPDRYRYQVEEKSDLQRLSAWLEREGVSYVDLYGLFRDRQEVLYYARDSHWNQKGAALVYQALLDACGVEHETYDSLPYVTAKDYYGDLNRMLYSVGARPEEEIRYQKEFTYSYVTGDDVEDSYIQTFCDQGKKNLLMYRDSFGNSLLPYFAQTFCNATFSKQVPYPMTDLVTARPDVVILEKVERHLPTLGTVAPLMSGPRRRPGTKQERAEGDTCLTVRKSGSYWAFEGIADERLMETDGTIRIEVNDGSQTAVYEAFCVQRTSGEKVSDYGFVLYLSEILLEGEQFDVKVLTQNGEKERILWEGQPERVQE